MTPLPSSEVKATVTPIARPEKRQKASKGLKRSQMERKPSKLKHTKLGRTTVAQKLRVQEQVCVVCGEYWNECQPAHVVPRGHSKMSDVAADDMRAVVPLCWIDHKLFDEGKIDLSSHLEPAWRDSQEWAAGAVGLASALRSITGEARLRAVSDDGETG